MELLRAGPDAVACAGDILDPTDRGFEGALDMLRRSGVQAPTVDLSRVGYISGEAIGLLVALWVDMLAQGRRFDLTASDRVWDVLGSTGVAGVFFKKPERVR